MNNLDEIFELIENKVDIKNDTFFSVIIGNSPSKGARSPLLWNHAFKGNGYDYQMYPFDVKKNNLKKLLEKLNNNKYFLGGAVTIPYKEDIAEILKSHLTYEAKKIGAVNCLFRDNNNEMNGTNTDGEASLKVYIEKFGNIRNKKILLLGPGGAGKAVSTYFSNELIAKSNLYIAGRSAIAQKFVKKINASWLDWKDINNKIMIFDIIINCTNVGSGDLFNLSPLNEKVINHIQKKAIVYDIIYSPSPTKLIKMVKSKNLKTLNGKLMNLEQAVIAFDYCLKKDKRKAKTRDLMFEKYKSLK